ncbi:hypothetical protein JCM11641_008379 [Rhodosporidiobolus odoratus]
MAGGVTSSTSAQPAATTSEACGRVQPPSDSHQSANKQPDQTHVEQAEETGAEHEGGREEWERAQEVLGEAALVAEENLKLREQLKELEDELEATPDPRTAAADGSKRLASLEQSLSSLEAILSVLREDASSATPDPILHRSELVAEEMAFNSIESTVEELERTLEWEGKRKEEEERKSERDKVYLADAEQLNTSLSKRVQQARQDEQQPDGEVLVLRAQARLSALDEQFGVLQRALVQFVDEKLVEEEPEENAIEGQGKRKRLKIEAFNLHRYIHAAGKEQAEPRAFQLKKLIEHLMNMAVTSPLDPYLTLSSLDPEPPTELVTFLLRSRIAREHLRDTGRVGLMDFAAIGGAGK